MEDASHDVDQITITDKPNLRGAIIKAFVLFLIVEFGYVLIYYMTQPMPTCRGGGFFDLCGYIYYHFLIWWGKVIAGYYIICAFYVITRKRIRFKVDNAWLVKRWLIIFEIFALSTLTAYVVFSIVNNKKAEIMISDIKQITEVKVLQINLDMYYDDFGFYPQKLEDLLNSPNAPKGTFGTVMPYEIKNSKTGEIYNYKRLNDFDYVLSIKLQNSDHEELKNDLIPGNSIFEVGPLKSKAQKDKEVLAHKDEPLYYLGGIYYNNAHKFVFEALEGSVVTGAPSLLGMEFFINSKVNSGYRKYSITVIGQDIEGQLDALKNTCTSSYGGYACVDNRSIKNFLIDGRKAMKFNLPPKKAFYYSEEESHHVEALIQLKQYTVIAIESFGDSQINAQELLDLVIKNISFSK